MRPFFIDNFAKDSMQVGAHPISGDRCQFAVWAPRREKVEVKLLTPETRQLPLEKSERGYWRCTAANVAPGTDYIYLLDGSVERPDPASSFQPEGVHGPSRIINHAEFTWSDQDWTGLALEDLVIYELHIGTFTEEGTFNAAIPRLDELHDLGITAVELMPVAQFPGRRNWGYDGACPFAVQNSYGGPSALKQLIDACHQRGLAVILDVVYNHLGPEGNYLRDFGPYFTDHYRTPWGEALNFDSAGSDEVRKYFIANALQWLRHYHVDMLRLDAVHAIYDASAKPFLQELAEQVQNFSREQKRRCELIAESDLNDTRIIRPVAHGGFGLDAQWSDDFHHSLHVLLTDERQGYYSDFGALEDLSKAFREGFVYTWRYSAHRQRHHGSPSADMPAEQFVICSQNHDQVGNRLFGERLISLCGDEGAKLAAAAVIMAPAVPLLFMGEEYGETAPFLYFVDFTDPGLIEAVRQGRKEEFKAFDWTAEPPDPQAESTFKRSRLNWERRYEEPQRHMTAYYRELLRLRRELAALRRLDKTCIEVTEIPQTRLLMLRRWQADSEVVAFLNFSTQDCAVNFPQRPGSWEKLIDSADRRWNGPGAESGKKNIVAGQTLDMKPLSAVLYARQQTFEDDR